MKQKQLAGSALYWIAASKSFIDGIPQEHAFPTRREAVHFIDHRAEGWDGWRLLKCCAVAEVRP